MSGLLANARVRLSLNTPLQVRRALPGSKAKILVEVGQEVKPTDILAEGQTFAGFRTIPLADELNVPPKEAPLYLKRQLGQMIYRGELLAVREGFWGFRKKEVISPVDGVLEYLDPGQGNLRIKLLPQRKQLVSGVYGVVDRISRSLGRVVIRTMADVIYGVAGSGQERAGILRVLNCSDSLVSARQIEPDFTGRIIVCGSLVTRDALEKAVALRVGGLITGGINAADFREISGGRGVFRQKRWTDIGVSLLVTEGFGSVGIGGDLCQLLKKYDGQFAFLDGNQAKLVLPVVTPNSMIYIRKTKFPETGPVGFTPSLTLVELKPGARVRVVSPPCFGEQGLVRAIDRTPTRLTSGVATFMVTVEMSSQKIKIPYLNLEVVG